MGQAKAISPHLQMDLAAEFLSRCVHSTTEMLGLRRSADARNVLTAFSYLSQVRFA
jgi:hypothetical protein